MLRLPKLPFELRQTQREILVMRGINYSDRIQDGDIADSENISARRWPYFSARNRRVKQDGYSGATAFTAYNKLVAVIGDKLIVDGVEVGTVTPGEKKFAVVNSRLVIFPDKKYLDLESNVIVDMEVHLSGAACFFDTDALWILGTDGVFPGAENINRGDTVIVSGATVKPGNNKSVTIKEVTAEAKTVGSTAYANSVKLYVGPDVYEEADESANMEIHIDRNVPDMDYICESDNRLWGCSNEARTIHASALGDPTNFNTFEGLSTDSYTLAIGSEGDFTGCGRLSSSVMFWKETKLHKILGGYPAEYTLYTYSVEGLRAGCDKSLQVINDTLYYMGLHGVYAYNGSSPALISPNFGSRNFTDGVAGTDGDSYYLSVREGDLTHLFVFETRQGIWVREGSTRCKDFGRIGRRLYMLDDTGEIYLMTGEEADPNLLWSFRLTPFYETMQGRKVYNKLIFRLELPKDSYVIAETRTDGGLWEEAAKMVGSTYDSVPLAVRLKRCDKFEIRVRGKGPCTILGISRQFTVGSDAG